MKPLAFVAAAFAVGILLHPGCAQAREKKVVVNAANSADFTTVVKEVRAQMAPGGRFDLINGADRQRLEKSIAEMQALFDKRGAVSSMTAPEKITLFNDQEVVNGILAHDDADRVICKTEMPMGSLIPKATCRSRRSREMQQRDARDFNQNLLHTQNPRGGKG